MTAMAGQLEEFQQPLLERQRAQLDRAQDHLGTAVRADGSNLLALELLGPVRDEVAAGPVAVEHRGELRHNVVVPCLGDADVPLETGDLRRVRQVRGPDVRRREARPPVEDPGLGMEPGRREVVGDPHVRTDGGELVERALLRRARVGRGEHAELSAVFAVAAQARQQWRDPAAPDEGHHGVDCVR